GFAVAFTGLLGLLDLSVLNNIEIRTYLGNTIQETINAGSLAQVGLLPGSGDVNLISFSTSAPFDGVRIRVTKGISAVSTVRIVFGFGRYDTDGHGMVDCVEKCPGDDDLQDADGDGLPDACDDPVCHVNAGFGSTVCPPDAEAQLSPAGPGQSWEALPGNPAAATVDDLRAVTGVPDEGEDPCA